MIKSRCRDAVHLWLKLQKRNNQDIHRRCHRAKLISEEASDRFKRFQLMALWFDFGYCSYFVALHCMKLLNLSLI